MDEKPAKNGYLYAAFSQEHLSKSKSHSLNAAHDQKTSLAQRKSVHHDSFVTFAFRSKCRVNKTTS